MKKDVSGIYKIECNVNNKIYIGSSVSIKGRFSNHRSRLKNNTHSNPHLQRAYNKYGIENFEFSIIEETDELEVRELCWINYFNACNPKIGYNVLDFVDRKGRPINFKEWIITFPDGTEDSIYNLSDFCRKNDLSQTAMLKVANRSQNIHKGYKCRSSKISLEYWLESKKKSKSTSGWKGKWRILFPDGHEEIVDLLSEFCKINNVNPDALGTIASGKRKTPYNGFLCVRDDGISQFNTEKLKQTKWMGSWIVRYPNGTDAVINNLTNFCEENNLQLGCMIHVSQGKNYNHKYFRCIKNDGVSVFTEDFRKKYLITPPNGKYIIVENLLKFCLENNLTYRLMLNACKSGRKHKNHLCKKITGDDYVTNQSSPIQPI